MRLTAQTRGKKINDDSKSLFIIQKVKEIVYNYDRDAQLILFGSRARGDWHEESDWDILVLTKEKYSKTIKGIIHDKLFPFSVSVGTIFQFIVANQDDWKHHPGYYTLHLGIENEMVTL